jgi:ribosomal protein S18 acetylase RimI-like enzyme
MGAADAPLSRRLELIHAGRAVRYAEAQARLVPESGAVSSPIGGGFAVYAGPSSPLNCATAVGLAGALQEPEFEELEAFYASRSEPTRVALSPLADATLHELVRQRRYFFVDFQNVYYRYLQAPLPQQTASANVRIVPCDAKQAELWITTTALGFAGDPAEVDAVRAIVAPTFHSEGAKCYLALIGAAVVGGAAMVFHDDGVELGGASTLPAWRRRGVQSALLDERLRDAIAAGAEIALVVTRPGGPAQRNIERCGFHLAYSVAILEQPSS